MSNLTKLKIKLKSLAAEARIIRKEELKRKGKWAYQAESLTHHRRCIVRPEARATHIAYGLLRGLEYCQVESYSKTSPDWTKVREMVKKYSDSENRKENLTTLESWIENQEVLEAA